MRIIVDTDVCEAYGQCVLVAGRIFDLGDTDDVVTVIDPEPDEAMRSVVQDAVDACPVGAISVEG